MNGAVANNMAYLSIYAGEGVALGVALTNPNGSSLDLTGYTFEGLMNFTPAVAISVAGGTISCPTPASGQFQLILTSAQTKVPAGPYAFEIWLKNAGGSFLPPITGTLSIDSTISTLT